jgi:hypothetical protein
MPPRHEFKEGPLPRINSNKQDLLLGARPEHDAHIVHAYADWDWATCVKTQRSFGGAVICLAGGTIAYKSKFKPTVAGSSAEAEFMAAYDTGKMILFVRSVLWDLGIPQEVASILYKDNDACTAMGNTQKPTARTRHMDIKYSLYVNRWTATSCIWTESTRRLTWPITSQKALHVLSFIVMPTSSSATFHLCIHLYIK